MGRFDSPLSVATLFLGATVVSVGLIFLLDAEAESRLAKQHSSTKYPLRQIQQQQETTFPKQYEQEEKEFTETREPARGNGEDNHF